MILLILVLATACAFLFLQNNIIYTDDGGIRLKLPFLALDTEEKPVENELQNDPNFQLQIDEPVVSEPPPVEEEPLPEVIVQPERKLAAFDLLPDDGEALRTVLESTGANGFVYTVRDNSGRVFYDSNVAMRDAVVAGVASKELLEQICDMEDVMAVARLNCFHDSYYAWTHMEEAGVCQSTGYIWYDSNSYFWLDPEKESTREYVISLALECAQLGFDELVLEEMCYPTKGKLEKIDYSGNTLEKAEALELFLKELQEALAPYDVKISLLLGEDVLLSGDSEVSGENLTKLLPMVDAVYAATEDSAAAEAALARHGGDDAPVFIPILDVPAQQGNWCAKAP